MQSLKIINVKLFYRIIQSPVTMDSIVEMKQDNLRHLCYMGIFIKHRIRYIWMRIKSLYKDSHMSLFLEMLRRFHVNLSIVSACILTMLQ